MLDNPTAKPPVGAAAVSVTEQAVDPGVWMVAPQDIELRAVVGCGTVTVIVPPLPEAGIAFASDATTPVSPTVRVPDAFAANWKFATAIVPFGIGVVFKPNTTQLDPPQLTDLPEELADAPASTEPSVTPDGSEKLHCTAVGEALEEEIEIGRETVEPASPEPDPMLIDTDCAIAAAEDSKASTNRTMKLLRTMDTLKQTTLMRSADTLTWKRVSRRERPGKNKRSRKNCISDDERIGTHVTGPRTKTIGVFG